MNVLKMFNAFAISELIVFSKWGYPQSFTDDYCVVRIVEILIWISRQIFGELMYFMISANVRALRLNSEFKSLHLIFPVMQEVPT